jgi:nucleotide-binding universal stress UspA family protein
VSASSDRRVPRPWSRARTAAVGELPEGLRRRDRRIWAELQSQQHSELPELVHPVIIGYDGSASARNALAYSAGMAKQLGRPLLMVYVASSRGRDFASATGRVVADQHDAEALERWLLSELDQVTDSRDLDVHVRTRRGSPPRELAAIAAELQAEALVIGVPRSFWHHATGSVSGWLARHPRCPVIVVP